MGVDRLRSLLRSHKTVGLDTSILIYQLERNPRYFPLSDAVFGWLAQRGNTAITSVLTMTELLVPAYREGDTQRLQTYYGLLTTYPGLTWVAPDLGIADTAAGLRAEYRLRTPDAIHAATAIRSQATAFLTNDPVFRRVRELETLIMDDML